MIKGLSCRFKLTNGKFEMTGGGEKASDNVFFLLNFNDNVKVYYPDFNPDVLWVIQKSSTNINSYKALILGKIKRCLEQYTNNITINSMDIQIPRSNRANAAIYLDYSYTEPGSTMQDYSVTFI